MGTSVKNHCNRWNINNQTFIKNLCSGSLADHYLYFNSAHTSFTNSCASGRRKREYLGSRGDFVPRRMGNNMRWQLGHPGCNSGLPHAWLQRHVCSDGCPLRRRHGVDRVGWNGLSGNRRFNLELSGKHLGSHRLWTRRRRVGRVRMNLH